MSGHCRGGRGARDVRHLSTYVVMQCNISIPTTCSPLPKTLIYPGSDLDVGVVQHLAPWENHILLVDTMWNQGVPDAGWEHYNKRHVNDKREAFRRTTRKIRSDCTTNGEDAFGASNCSSSSLLQIGNLLEARLQALEPVSRVRRLSMLSVEFHLAQHGDVQMHFVNAKWDPPNVLPLPPHLHALRGTVSTIVQTGYASNYCDCTMLPPRDCLPVVRLIGTLRDREWFKWANKIHVASQVSYPQDDALAGNGNDITLFCAQRWLRRPSPFTC